MWSDSERLKQTAPGNIRDPFRQNGSPGKTPEQSSQSTEASQDRLEGEGRFLRKLTYFRNGLIKRFPNCSKVDIDIAIEQTLEVMRPSRDRTRLKRLVIKTLTSKTQSARNGVQAS